MRYLPIVYSIFFICLFSCTPKAVVKNLSIQKPAKEAFESFAVFELEQTFESESAIKIGQIQVKETGLSLICDYPTVLNIAKQKAMAIGGNCLKVVEHKTPDYWSTCHRIKCDVYEIANAWEFEKEIFWDERRKLKIRDFKGSVENRPFEAATYSYFIYQYSYLPITGKFDVQVWTLFDAQKSYLKKSDFDSLVLEHEQIHFDISELYARKFTKRILEECNNFKTFEEKHSKIYQEITTELAKKQDLYDSEVYPNPSKQSEWIEKIHHELKQLKEFDIPLITIKNEK